MRRPGLRRSAQEAGKPAAEEPRMTPDLMQEGESAWPATSSAAAALRTESGGRNASWRAPWCPAKWM
jgi:hypothetical protein